MLPRRACFSEIRSIGHEFDRLDYVSGTAFDKFNQVQNLRGTYWHRLGGIEGANWRTDGRAVTPWLQSSECACSLQEDMVFIPRLHKARMHARKLYCIASNRQSRDNRRIGWKA